LLNLLLNNLRCCGNRRIFRSNGHRLGQERESRYGKQAEKKHSHDDLDDAEAAVRVGELTSRYCLIHLHLRDSDVSLSRFERGPEYVEPGVLISTPGLD
jgi:hypothetical protein